MNKMKYLILGMICLGSLAKAKETCRCESSLQKFPLEKGVDGAWVSVKKMPRSLDHILL